MDEKQKDKGYVLRKLFFASLYLSTFTFGGGYVIVTLLKEKFVDQYHWIDEDEMLDLVAIAQSSPGAIAEDHNVDLVFHLLCVIYRIYLGCLSQDLNSLRSTTGKYAHQFHIRIMFDCTFYSTSQVTIAQDTNTNTHSLIPPIPPHMGYSASASRSESTCGNSISRFNSLIRASCVVNYFLEKTKEPEHV